MNVHQNLAVRGTIGTLQALIPHLDTAASAAQGWRCETDVQHGPHTQGIPRNPSSVQRWYACTASTEREAARVRDSIRASTHARIASEMYVSEVVATAIDDLDAPRYNAIVNSFAREVITPAIAAACCGAISVTMTASNLGLDEWVGAGGEWQLRSLSRLASGGLAAASPEERQQWHAFVVGLQRAGKRLHPRDLVRWLVDEAGWESEFAHSLAGEYERNVALLRVNEEFAAAAQRLGCQERTGLVSNAVRLPEVARR